MNIIIINTVKFEIINEKFLPTKLHKSFTKTNYQNSKRQEKKNWQKPKNSFILINA